jgi:hypothetical protein
VLLRNRPALGSRVPVKEIVFFGRLEGRKGLDVFCDAIRKLSLEGIKLPKITFLGKIGARIPTHPELSIPQYIKAQASSWNVDWQIIDSYRQADAISYLHGEGRLAVMPSVIENSSLTVYEATHFRIPFIASNCGGNPELVAKEHHKAVLTAPHPVPLSEKLREALEKGGFVAAPSFDNEENLTIWRNFHNNIATGVHDAYDTDRNKLDTSLLATNQGTKDLIEQLRRATTQKQPAKISACLVVRDDPEAIDTTLNDLKRSDMITEVVLVNDGSEDPATLKWLDAQRKPFRKRGWKIIDQPHYGTPSARNLAAAHVAGDNILFLDPGTRLKADAVATLSRAASYSDADLLLPFYEEASGNGFATARRVVSIKGDPCYPFFNPDLASPLVLVRASAFETLGGFTTDYKVGGDIAEFLASATMVGMTVETIPEVLAVRSSTFNPKERRNETGTLMRALRPYTTAAPLYFQPLLLAAAALEQRCADALERNTRFRAGIAQYGFILGPARVLLRNIRHVISMGIAAWQDPALARARLRSIGATGWKPRAKL